MNSKYIIDVTESDFEYEVINFSLNIPVIVDFWAEWCKPCYELEPILKKLVNEAHGSIRLARVDVDQNPNLAMRYSVRTIPTVKAFSRAEIVAEFASLQPEHRIREFLAKIVPPSPLSLAVEKGNALIEYADWETAETVFINVLEKQPDHSGALLGLAKVFLATGKYAEALTILSDFPESRQYARAGILKPVTAALLGYQKDTLPSKTDLDICFKNSIWLITKQNFPAALDGLLEIMREDRKYRDGMARNVFLGILEILGENNSVTRKYRSELASILF